MKFPHYAILNSQDLNSYYFFLGWTPIQIAAWRGFTEIVKILLPLVKNPNSKTKCGWTPMQLAVQYGHIDIVEALVNHCENPNEPNPMGWSPIQTAARRGQDDVIRYLIRIFVKLKDFKFQS